MAAPAFPSWINSAALQAGYAEQPETNALADQRQVGAPALRRRTSLQQSTITFTVRLSSLEWENVKTFYRSTLKDGTLQFTMNHPRTGVSATWAWVPGQPPKVGQTYGSSFEIVFTLRLISGGAPTPVMGSQPGVAIGLDGSGDMIGI
jgi:hypothetical protein